MPELESKKTSGLTALGVLSVVLGALFFIGAVWGLLHPQVHQVTVKQANAVQILTGFGLTGAYVVAGVDLLLAGLLFAAGVGLLKLRKWGARLAVWYAVARIAWSAIAALLAIIGPRANAPGADQVAAQHGDAMTRFPAISLTLILAGFILSILYPVILLCLLSRRTYKDNLT